MKVLQYKLLFVTALQLLEIYVTMLADHMEKEGKIFDKEMWELMKLVKDGSITYAVMAMYDYEMLKFYPSTIAAGCIYAIILKLSEMHHHQYDEFLINCVKVLSSEEEQNVNEMEECAKELVKLENSFSSKFEGPANVHLKQMMS